MTNLQFTKATKTTAKLRLAIFGPSGSGKTYTALRMATGMGDTIAVIDTERGSASKYADRFKFDVLELPAKDIGTYVQAINAAGKADYPILIIDSLTHAWHELLAEVDKIAATRYSGNTWSAWSEGTPKQRKLVNAILEYPGHVIATMRTKTEWTLEKDNRTGKNKPVRIGLSPEQGKGIEYEFDLLMEINVAHIATVIKDRTGVFQDRIIEMPDEDLGTELASWLNDGTAPKPKKVKPEQPTNGRPYPPQVLKERIGEIAVLYDNQEVSDRDRHVVASQLDTIFDGDTTKRYELCKWLVDEASTKKILPAYIWSFLQWLRVSDYNDPPAQDAITEARIAHAFALGAAGQAELEL